MGKEAKTNAANAPETTSQPVESKLDETSRPPKCPYCGTSCRNVGKQFGVTYFRCDKERGGCGNYSEKVGKPKAPPFNHQGFSARP